MCEMLTAMGNSSECHMVLTEEAEEAPRVSGHQRGQGAFALVMTEGKQEYVVHDKQVTKRSFQELYVLMMIRDKQEYVVGLQTWDLE